jgi:predicted lipid-binding transport protein (Tim44 family)
MQEIILYAVLTLIVGAMLYSVLGKDVGEGSENAFDPKDMLDKLGNEKTELVMTQIFEGPAAKGLEAISKADPSFTLAGFVDGSQAAYALILESYADGDKEMLKELLNPSVGQSYLDAIDARAEKNLTQTTDLARLISAEVVRASRTGKKGKISVLYVAELATALINEDGDVVEGDLDVLSRVKEIWSYERTLGAKNPNWVLCAVEPHDVLTGDTGGPDHSPDTE